MSLITKAESMGRAVTQGAMSREDAIKELMEFSDGGLTQAGAADLIDNWRTIQTKYADALKTLIRF